MGPAVAEMLQKNWIRYVCEILVEKLRLRVVSRGKPSLDRAGAGKLKSGVKKSPPYFLLSFVPD